MADTKSTTKTDTPDVDQSLLSSDTQHSTYAKNPDPNPENLDPAPGPSTIQTPGLPKGEA